MLCALATLVTVPVLMSSGASSDGEEVAAVVVEDTVSAVELEADVDMDDLFEPGADLEAVPEVGTEEQDVTSAADATPAAPQSLVGEVELDAAAATTTVTSTTISAAPATPVPPPTTAAPTTQAPTTTAAPTTQPPTTAAPTTAAPTTAAPTTTAAAEQATTTTAPVVEEPQAPAPSTPTAEQWAALRHCESSGNYSIVSRNGLYHGAYQFYQPTWDGLANQVARADLVGLPPSQAAPADQDALALLLWQQRGSQPWPVCGRHLPSGP